MVCHIPFLNTEKEKKRIPVNPGADQDKIRFPKFTELLLKFHLLFPTHHILRRKGIISPLPKTQPQSMYLCTTYTEMHPYKYRCMYIS